MLISKTVKVKWNSRNKKHYELKGYIFTKWKDEFEVKIEDLMEGSNVKVDVQCDGCSEILKNVAWNNYLRYVKSNGKYYCNKCAIKLFGANKISKTRLKNGKSFKQWCIINGKQDILNRWDYELNDCKPNEITYSTNKKYYFKCPRGLHESELKSINDFTSDRNSNINCKACNSFAQYLINTYGDKALELYWDYDKNNKLKINPWKISKGTSNKKVYIKCQDKNYHDSYPVAPNVFIDGHRCPYCYNMHGSVHKLDSLGYLYPEVLDIWSNKNKKSPYEYSPFSQQDVYWKCPEDKHDDYPRKISESNVTNFRCPECNYSKGEERISNDLINNKGFIKISQEEFIQLINEDKYNKNYFISQKEYSGLVGLGNGNLSYDFYIPRLNLLIEYQGEFHDGTAYQQTYEDFLKQQEHDRRKRKYAKINNINALEIWYWDFDRIEEILDNYIR